MPLRGTLMVPGDKSITHRAIILSALADGEATISNYCPGEDCLHTAAAFQAMGVPVEIAPDRLRVTGKGLWGLREPDSIVDCGNSGTGIRLLAGVLAGLFAEGTTSVTEPGLSRDHTERLFAYLGIPVTRNVLTVSLTGQRAFTAKDIAVAGDLSAAAFFLVAASLVPNSEVTITGVGVNPTRTGVLEILQAMGADIELLNPRAQAREAVADLRVRSAA